MDMISYLMGKASGGGGAAPRGTLEITENGTYDVARYASAQVEVMAPAQAEKNDVIFYDYDGTRLYSFSAEDFAALTELPANPTRDGLSAQGWNWTLEEAQAYVAKYGALDVGQMYNTSDGASRFYVSTPGPQFYAQLMLTGDNLTGITIDWGDGTTEVPTEWDAVEHSYTNAGDYIISITVPDGVSVQVDDFYIQFLNGFEIGNGVSSIGGMGAYVPFLVRVVLPRGVNLVDDDHKNTFEDSQLTHLTVPEGSALSGSIGGNLLYLQSISLPPGVTDFQDSFLGARRLERITIPEGVTEIAESAFSGCRNLSRVVIPEGVKTIGANVFDKCERLYGDLTIPSSVTEIGDLAFKGSYFRALHFRSTTPPKLGTLALTGNGAGICYVPAGSVDAYKADSTWKNYINRIREEPQ